MKPEEQLEHMITTYQRGEESFLAVSEEISSRLAAVELLHQLKQIDVPPEFAARLEQNMRSHIRNRVVKEGTVKVQSPLRLESKGPIPFPAQRFAVRKIWITTLGIAAILLLVYASVVTDFTQNLPGSPLYHQKQSEQQSALTVTQDQQNQSPINIHQLYSALTDLNAAVNAGQNDDEIKQKLSTVVTKTNDSRAAVTSVSASSSEYAQDQRDLNQALSDEKSTLHQLLPHVDWPIQLAFTQQLGAIGDTIPIITNVTVSLQSNGIVLVTLSGTGFVQASSLIIDGQVQGTVTNITSTQLLANISQSNWSHTDHTIGILTPDYMANQFVENDDGHSGSDDHNTGETSTPVVQATGTALHQ